MMVTQDLYKVWALADRDTWLQAQGVAGSASVSLTLAQPQIRHS